jgi:proteasome lid subunit RPN8/RPN11
MNWFDDAKSHLKSCYPNEGCGVVINDTFVPIRNVSPRPRNSFTMDNAQLLEAQDVGELQAIVHSHPDASPHPSHADRMQAEGYGVPWYIASVSAQDVSEFVSFEPDGFVAPLLDREFAYGKLDCYALVRDYYSRELGIELPDFDRDVDHWWKDPSNTFDPFEQHWQEAGFVEVHRANIKVGDIILMQVFSTNQRINHCGVYIGDGVFMHHMEGKLSKRERYGGYWFEVTRKIVRKA